MTREHVWPDWIGRMFFDYKRGDHAPLAPHRASSSLKHEPDREWTAPSFTSEAKVVCKDCNEGWMNDLEAAAKPILAPMLRGKRVVLDTDAQAIVARWLTKTAMVFQRTTPRRPVPERHTRYLYDHRRPPPSCQVWIGARTAEDGGILSGIQSARLKPEAAEPAGQVFSAYLVTVGIAAFVGQLFGHDLPRFDFPWGHEGMFASAVEQIWPPFEPIQWPPKHVIGAVKDFAEDPSFGQHLGRSFAGQGVELRAIWP